MLCWHSNETRASNPSNSAQLEGTPTIPPTYIAFWRKHMHDFENFHTAVQRPWYLAIMVLKQVSRYPVLVPGPYWTVAIALFKACRRPCKCLQSKICQQLILFLFNQSINKNFFSWHHVSRKSESEVPMGAISDVSGVEEMCFKRKK